MSQTTTYRLDPNRMESEERRILTTQLPKVLMINAVATVVVLLMTVRNEPSTMLILGEVVFIGILTCWMIFNSIRQVKKSVQDMYATYELKFDGNGIALRAKSVGSTRIDFADITRIEEVEGYWISVIGKSSQQRIGIPRQLVGFDEVAERLRIYGTFEKKNYPSHRMYAAVPFLVTYGVALWAHTPILVALACVAMWGFLLWAVIYLQRSTLVTKKTKRTMWIAIFPVLSIIPRFLWAIEQLRK